MVSARHVTGLIVCDILYLLPCLECGHCQSSRPILCNQCRHDGFITRAAISPGLHHFHFLDYCICLTRYLYTSAERNICSCRNPWLYLKWNPLTIVSYSYPGHNRRDARTRPNVTVALDIVTRWKNMK